MNSGRPVLGPRANAQKTLCRAGGFGAAVVHVAALLPVARHHCVRCGAVSRAETAAVLCVPGARRVEVLCG